MFNKKILLCLQSIIILAGCLLAQDISTGIKLVKNQKYAEAKKYFTSLLNTESKTEAYFYLGQIYFLQDKLDSAKACYSKGIESDIEYPLNYAGMVKINVAEKNSSEVEKYQNEVIDLDEKNPSVYIVLSEAYSNPKVKNYEKAIELLNNAMKIAPKNTEAHISLGRIYLERGNGTEAIKNFQGAIDIDAANPEALTLKAKVYSLISNYDDAIPLLLEAIKSDPSYSPAYNELAELHATLKDYSKAAEYYSKYIENSEITTEKQKRFASILYLNKEYTKAINILNDISQKEPDNPTTIRTLAYSYLRLEDIENSVGYFEKLFAIPSAEFLPTDYENYADLLGKTGNDSLAIVYLYKVVDLDSTRKDVLGKISVTQFKNKNWSGVITALERKKTLTAQEYFDLGKAYYFVGEKAITEVTQNLSTTLNLNSEQQYEVRAALLRYQKEATYANDDTQRMAAAEAVNKKIESFVNASQKSQWTSVKDTWWEEVHNKIHQDYAKADSTFNILVTKVPDLAIAYFWQARIKSNFDPESDSGLAKPPYEQFITLSKEDTSKYKRELIEAYSYLGYYHFLKEDNESSKLYWEKVYALDPNNNQAIEALKNL